MGEVREGGEVKTAKKWYAEYCNDRKLPDSQRKLGASNGDLIRAVQLDAWKQGMTDAAEVNHKWSAGRPMSSRDIDRASLEIKSVRDSKTTL